MKILGIETSCDDTGVAIYDSDLGLLSDRIANQDLIHNQYGGVVPELASRKHLSQILPLINGMISDLKTKANSQFNNQHNLKNITNSIADIDGIAYTLGPGLFGSLLVGGVIGRSLGWMLNIPTIGVHHLEGHLLSPFLEKEKPSFPFLSLLVSGGHTMLVAVKNIGEYKILGSSLDDAAGEAFDKTAKLLGLNYPGGRALEKLAQSGDKEKFNLPRPLAHSKDLNFSFSGLKTAVARLITRSISSFSKDLSTKNQQIKADIAASFQNAVIDILVLKSVKALKATGLKQLVIAGGVSSNKALRQAMDSISYKNNIKIYYPSKCFCTDNGAMIAYAGCQRLLAGRA